METISPAKLSDKEIVEGILHGDKNIITQFFCNDCKSLFYYIHSTICNFRIDPNEIANTILLYLSEKDWRKLRQFDFRSKLITWLSVVAIRYYKKIMSGMIDMASIDTLYSCQDTQGESPEELETRMDIAEGLRNMPNQRYRMVIQALDLQEKSPEELAKEMNITTANLYNIHRRALQQLKAVMS